MSTVETVRVEGNVSKRDWVPYTHAAKEFEVTRSVIQGMVNRGQVAVLDIPGSKPLVSRSDVEKVVKAACRPARVKGEGDA